MRAKQRVGGKKNNKGNSGTKGIGAKIVIVKPAGYPLKSMFHEYPEPSELDVFEIYAREQWSGYVVKKGDFLFDKRMFPDFAFQVMDVEPENSEIGKNTRFIIQDYETSVVPEIRSDITFEDVIGQERAKQKCKIIEKYLSNPLKFGRWAPKNILFYGPSGTGKTMMAKALANSVKAPLLPIRATTLIGEYVGDGARQIHRLYDKAEELAPCIVFIDEFDAIALSRSYQEIRGDVTEIVNALLTEMDGINDREGICTIAVTNMCDSIDPAIRSRFEEEIEFTLPNEQERYQMLKQYISTFPIKIEKDVNLKKIARLTKGFSGRDIVEKLLKNVLHKAMLSGDTVKKSHFKEVLAEIIENNSQPEGMFA